MKKILFSFISILWVCFIFYNSTQTAIESSQASGNIISIVNSGLDYINVYINPDVLSIIIRKLAHMFEFFILYIILYILLKEYKIKNIFYLSLSFCIIIAFSDEGIQLFVEGRSSSIVDVLFDTTGALLGFIFYLLINTIIEYKKSKRMLNKR